MNNRVILRVASILDMELLFKWTNEKSVRLNSFNSEMITKKEHQMWFENLLKDSEKIQLIGEIEDCPFGQIRFSKSDDSVYIGYSIDVHFRGKGLGADIIDNGIKYILSKNDFSKNIIYVVGEVKKSNIASMKTFEKLHFDLYDETESKYVYRKRVR